MAVIVLNNNQTHTCKTDCLSIKYNLNSSEVFALDYSYPSLGELVISHALFALCSIDFNGFDELF